MVYALYSRHYSIRVFYVDSSDSGHAGSTRFRAYIVMWLKKDIVEVFDMTRLYDEIVAETKKHCRTKPSDYRLSPDWERLREAEQLAIARGKKLRTAPSLLVHSLERGNPMPCVLGSLELVSHKMRPRG